MLRKRATRVLFSVQGFQRELERFVDLLHRWDRAVSLPTCAFALELFQKEFSEYTTEIEKQKWVEEVEKLSLSSPFPLW